MTNLDEMGFDGCMNRARCTYELQYVPDRLPAQPFRISYPPTLGN
jgi:hypothetical protein